MKTVLNTHGVDRTKACFQYLSGQGVSPYSGSIAYVLGDVVQLPNKSLWRNISPTTGNAPPSATYWAPVDAAGERKVIIRDAYFLGPPVWYPSLTYGTFGEANFGAYPLVDGDLPLVYQGAASAPITFQPFSIEKDKLTYKTGFEASKLTLTVRPRDPLTMLTAPTAPYARGKIATGYNATDSYSEGLQVTTPYVDAYAIGAGFNNDNNPALLQTMRQSFAQVTDWYLAPLTVFRFFMPTYGDVTSYGGAVMFRGRVSDLVIDKEDIKVTVTSLMEIFKQKVPTQTVQPGNRWAPFNPTPSENFFGSTLTPAAGAYNWASLKFGNPSTTALVDGDLAEGWALISNGYGNWWRRIVTNQNTQSVAGQIVSTLVFLEDLPFSCADTPIDARCWISGDTGNTPGAPGQGFPYVPQPLTGIA